MKSYESETEVKSVKLQTFRIQYETLKMHDDESNIKFLSRVYEVVNSMRNLGEEIKYSIIIQKFRDL